MIKDFLLLISISLQYQTSRAVIIHFANSIKRLAGEPLEEIASFAVTSIKNHLMSFDEADYILRDTLCAYYLATEQFKDAAIILSGINLESSTTPFSDTEKTEVYVKCAGSITNMSAFMSNYKFWSQNVS
jgi:hypothetical protein